MLEWPDEIWQRIKKMAEKKGGIRPANLLKTYIMDLLVEDEKKYG